jgi:3-hydroxyisobutyrate dehydrogenase
MVQEQVLGAGVLGLGRMGAPMTRCIVQSGFATSVFDLDADAMARAVADGARATSSPAAVAAASDVVCVVVLDLAQVEDVLFGTDGVMTGATPGLVVCLCSTVDDDAVLDLAARAAEHHVHVIDTGVAGGPINAEIASLVTMVGGPEATLARARPVLEAFSGDIVHAGPLGAGMRLKLVKNLGSYLVMCAANETLRFADALGIPAEVVQHVNAASNMLGQFWDMTAERENQRLAPDAPADEIAQAVALAALARKDLDAILALAARVDEDLPAARTAHDLADRYFRVPLA